VRQVLFLFALAGDVLLEVLGVVIDGLQASIT
jgi:small neutral amino acid transporter SnatA (MarC family)